jgi:hypothetical protein
MGLLAKSCTKRERGKHISREFDSIGEYVQSTNLSSLPRFGFYDLTYPRYIASGSYGFGKSRR